MHLSSLANSYLLQWTAPKALSGKADRHKPTQKAFNTPAPSLGMSASLLSLNGWFVAAPQGRIAEPSMACAVQATTILSLLLSFN